MSESGPIWERRRGLSSEVTTDLASVLSGRRLRDRPATVRQSPAIGRRRALGNRRNGRRYLRRYIARIDRLRSAAILLQTLRDIPPIQSRRVVLARDGARAPWCFLDSVRASRSIGLSHRA